MKFSSEKKGACSVGAKGFFVFVRSLFELLPPHI